MKFFNVLIRIHSIKLTCGEVSLRIRWKTYVNQKVRIQYRCSFWVFLIRVWIKPLSLTEKRDIMVLEKNVSRGCPLRIFFWNSFDWNLTRNKNKRLYLSRFQEGYEISRLGSKKKEKKWWSGEKCCPTFQIVGRLQPDIFRSRRLMKSDLSSDKR